MAKPRMTKAELRFVEKVSKAIHANKVEGLRWLQQPGFQALSENEKTAYVHLILTKTR